MYKVISYSTNISRDVSSNIYFNLFYSKREILYESCSSVTRLFKSFIIHNEANIVNNLVTSPIFCDPSPCHNKVSTSKLSTDVENAAN